MVRSLANITANKMTEIAAAPPTDPVLPLKQDDARVQDDGGGTPKTSHSHADSRDTRDAQARAFSETSVAFVQTELGEPGSPSETSSVQGTAHARARENRVSRMSLKEEDDDSDDGDPYEHTSNEPEPIGGPLTNGTTHQKDSGGNVSDEERSSELPLVQKSPKHTPTSVDSVGLEAPGEACEPARERTRSCDGQRPDNHSVPSESGVGHQTSMEGEMATEPGNHVAALTGTPREHAGTPRVSTRGAIAAGFEGIESWLVCQDRDRSLFVGASPSVPSRPGSEAPEVTPSAQTEVPLDNKTLKHGAWSLGKERGPLHDENASTHPNAGLSLPATARGSPRQSPASATSSQSAGREPSSVAENESSDATSSSATTQSSSERTSERPTDDSDAAKTARDATSPSVRSRSETDSSPSEASLYGSGHGEAWPDFNSRNLSSPLQFAMMGRLRRENVAIDPDMLEAMQSEAAAKYMRLMPPSIVAPYSMSVEEEEGGAEAWDGGHRTTYGVPRWHSDEDIESSHSSSGSSQGSPGPPHRHLGPRPESCACDICGDIAPLLTRVRAEEVAGGGRAE